MTDRRLEITGWALTALSVIALVGLHRMVIRDIGQWDAWQLSGALWVGMLSAAFAHGLTWRRGSSTLRGAAQGVAVVAFLVWLYTWFEPAAALVAWIRQMIHGFLGP